MIIDAKGLDYSVLNKYIKEAQDNEIILEGVNGQRYIGAGTKGRTITIDGVAGNALGAYLDGSTIICKTNAQDATGDTMNEGEIIIHGSSGDACGYAMRGGKIFVLGNAGYRAGIHMKAYKSQKPSIIIGGMAGDFLGEYQAGGNIAVLGLNSDEIPVGEFCGTGMHGGKIFIRSGKKPKGLPKQVIASLATEDELAEIMPNLQDFAAHFDISMDKIMEKSFYVLIPNTKNPYKQLYTHN